MKKFLLICLLCSGAAFCQSKLELTYKVTSTGSMINFVDKEKEILRPYIEQMEKELEDLIFTLQIKNKESIWKLLGGESYPASHMGSAWAGSYTYYFNASANEYMVQKNFLGTLFLVTQKPNPVKWQLMDESKTILGYSCKKAIYKEVKNIKGADKEFVTEAWYCPELKYKIGPQDFGGLDGLILELTDKKRKFYCTQILQGTKTSLFTIEKPNKGKPIKEEDFLNEINKIAEERDLPHD